MKKYFYSYSTLLGVVTTIMAHQPGVMQRARCKAVAWLLQGLLVWRAATLSGMGRGVALANEEKTLIGQLQRAHRLMRNDQFDAWAMASALYGYATQELSQVLLAVDWTDDGEYKVLEASLVIEGRATTALLFGRAQRRLPRTTNELGVDDMVRADSDAARGANALCGG